MKKIFRWSLVLIWMIIIFWFSNEPGVISDEKSKSVLHLFKILGLNLNSILGDIANFIVRKIGHFTEYMILYVILFKALKEHCTFKKALVLSIIFVFLYACSDEVHQLFVLGRSGKIKDVIIDTCGGLMAMTIIYLYNLKIKKL